MKEKIGSSFPLSFKIASIIPFALGLLSITSAILFGFSFIKLGIGFVLIFIAIIVVFTYTGLEIQRNSNMFREFTSILGFTFGKFKNLSDYCYISIIKADHGFKVYGRSNASFTVSNKKFDICIFNESFRKKVVLKICDTEEDAIKYAKIFSNETGFNLVQYNPPVSNSTARRREMRKR